MNTILKMLQGKLSLFVFKVSFQQMNKVFIVVV
jgi:hypothetical protein